MPKLRRLSGAEIVAILGHFGFTLHSQTLTVPAHQELDTGTCRAILRQAGRFISEAELRPYFYSD